MSDYLTQLITRSLDIDAVVRPRPMPLFAPERAVAQTVFKPERLAEETTLESLPMRPLQRSPTATSPIFDMPMQAEQSEQPPRDVIATPRHRAVQPPSLVVEPSADEAQPSEVVAPRRQPALVMPQPLSSLTAQTTPALPTSTSEKPPRGYVALQSQMTLALSAPRDVQPQFLAHSSLLMAQPPLKSISPSIQPTRRAMPPAVVPQPATAETTIHVTIGRVEVRATLAPAPATKLTRASAPVMSLDEYLRARSGDQR